MHLREIMATPVETISPDERVDIARERMRRLRIHHLVVTDGRRILGVLSDRDLPRTVDGAAFRVEEMMSPSAVTASVKLTVRQAANLLRGRGIGCIPIVEGEKLVGIVTVSDLLSLLGRGLQRPVERGKRWTLRHRGPRKRIGQLP